MIYRMPRDISKADSGDYGIVNVYLNSAVKNVLNMNFSK